LFIAKAMKHNLLFVLLIGVLLSCVEKYPAPIRSENSKLVVDGAISTSKPPYQVKLTYSGVFEYAFQTDGDKVEPNAKITLSDSLGNRTGFKYLGKGIYETTNLSFRGIIDQTYALLIELPDGRKFASVPEKIPPPVPIQRIYVEYYKKELNSVQKVLVRYQRTIPSIYPVGELNFTAEPDGPNGYRVFIDTQDPANATNYYRWTASSVTRRETTGRCDSASLCNCNCILGQSCFVPRQHLDLNIANDALINGNTIRRKYIFFSPVFTTGNIYLEINQMSMTRPAYQFWKRYQEQITRTGTILDPLPAPIEGNIYNLANPNELALGYFSALGNFKKRQIIPVQLLDFSALPVGISLRRGTCLEIYSNLGAYDTGEWPTPNWDTEELN
jgi:hypothetical protein